MHSFMVFIYDVTLDKALILLPTFLDSSEMLLWKEGLWSNLTPNSFSHLLLVMSKFHDLF